MHALACSDVGHWQQQQLDKGKQMTLTDLRLKLEDVNDYLVDTENDCLPDSWTEQADNFDQVFTLLHENLSYMLELVVSLIVEGETQ
jgi:predicted transcriptional regulator